MIDNVELFTSGELKLTNIEETGIGAQSNGPFRPVHFAYYPREYFYPGRKCRANSSAT